jgi:hypothetical protein
MLDPGVRFEGFDADDWARLIELMRGRAEVVEAGLVVVHVQGRVRKALRTEGLAQLAPGESWPQPIAQLTQSEGVAWLVAVEEGALDAWMSWIGRKVQRHHDMLDQLLVAWEGARGLATEGKLFTWPTSIETVPVPSRAMILGAVGLVCPPREAVVIAVWDEGKLWTSLALRRSTSGFDWMVGPLDFRGEVEAAGPDTESMRRCMLELVRQRLGPVALGIASDRATWRQVTQSGVGAFTKAALTGAVKVEPFARGVALPLAVEASAMTVAMLRATLGKTERSSEGSNAQTLVQLWRVAEGLWSLQRKARR